MSTLFHVAYMMSETEAHILPHKDEVMLCVPKCERTREKDVSCVCGLLSETLIRPLSVMRTHVSFKFSLFFWLFFYTYC